MKPSKFQLLEVRLLKLNYIVNPDFKFEGEIPIKASSKCEIKKSENLANIFLSIFLYDNEDSSQIPFKFEAIIEGQFTWDNQLSDEDIETLLKVNAPAILISYIRPFITQFTAYSNYPPLILPLMDFTISDK